MIRRAIVKTLHDHGLGRHTPSEIYGLMREDIDEVAAFLADRPYFMGEKPSSIDCIVSAFMANIVQVPLDSPARDAARSHQNLVEYCDRMRQAYFSDFKPS